MHARKIAQIADSRRHLRRGSGALTYRRTRKKGKKPLAHREIKISRKGPLFLTFLFCVSQYFFLQSSLFTVREVNIEGNALVPVETISTNLGLMDSTKYWNVSPGRLRDSVLELHRLENAQVEVTFPGRVDVKVSERVPVFSVAYQNQGNTWFAVDKDGVVLSQRKPPEGDLKILLARPVRVGSQLSQTERDIVLYFQQNLKPGLAKRLRAVKLNQRHEVALKLSFKNTSLWVRLGRPEKLAYKLFLLEELLKQLRSATETVTSIDLRYSTPVVKHAEPKT